jgi:hypothetical protein
MFFFIKKKTDIPIFLNKIGLFFYFNKILINKKSVFFIKKTMIKRFFIIFLFNII